MTRTDKVKIRIIGTPAQVNTVADQIRALFVDTYQSESQVSSKRNKRHVLRYITLKSK